MSDPRIKDLFRIHNRFMRSAHLERDFQNPSALDGYVLTDQAKHAMQRLAEGLRPNSRQRAWRITGGYGVGKSSLALVVAHLFTGETANLPAPIKRWANLRQWCGETPRLVPVLVTGSREPLSVAILRGVKAAIFQSADLFGSVASLVERIEARLDRAAESAIPDRDVVSLVEEATRQIVSCERGTGLLMIIDELGKYLEYAALRPESQDVYLLQSLAEAATRSGPHPLFVVGLLHQGFGTYADHLSHADQQEWAKVADRFEELLFNQPLEQVALLTASALDLKQSRIPTSVIEIARADMAACVELGWYGADASQKKLVELAPAVYPLHPTLLPALARLFARFGQNERSLFHFLLSNEPFGLQEFASCPVGEHGFYRLHHLYDYARAVFGYRLGLQSYRSHWNLIDSIVDSYRTEHGIDWDVLKTVGILNLLDHPALLASEDVIQLAVHGKVPSEDASGTLSRAVARLRDSKRILYYRGASGGYCLWPHTSVNLERCYEEAGQALGPAPAVSTSIQEYLENRPLVARRHYIETGTLRHFDIVYSPIYNLDDDIEIKNQAADGRVVFPLCENELERQTALEIARSEKLRQCPTTVIAVSWPLGDLAKLIHEVQRWQWIAGHTPDLQHDTYAAEEVERRIAEAKQVLQRRVDDFMGIGRTGSAFGLEWFCGGEKLDIPDSRSLLHYLSDLCERVFHKSPLIHNELVNRRTLSSAAAAARMRLIERMLTSPYLPLLGMDQAKKPPEMSIYLSILREAGAHKKKESGYIISLPDVDADICQLRPVLEYMEQLLLASAEARIPIDALMGSLRKPPFGIRDGVLPILLALFAVAHEQNIAFYHHGNFIRHISGEEFLDLTKNPETFEIQLCRVDGIRTEVFAKLLGALELSHTDGVAIDLLDVVRPLCEFAAHLPAYTHKTHSLSTTASDVRAKLLRVQEPAPLLFRELPEACGFAPFTAEPQEDSETVELYVSKLKQALDELRAAYPLLLDQIRTRLYEVFGITGPLENQRKLLAKRAGRMLITVIEPSLKALCFRIADHQLPETDWLEGIASYVCAKPPSKWIDNDLHLFHHKVGELGSQFRRVEAITFHIGQNAVTGSAIRVAITQTDGIEAQEIVFVTEENEAQVVELEAQISALIEAEGGLGLAAASRALWRVLRPTVLE